MLACPHRPPCPGCPRLGEPGIAPAAWRVLAEIARRAGLPPPVVLEGPPTGFRHRARLAVRGRARSPKIGIFREGTHAVVDTPRCLVHHPLVNRVAAAVKDAVRHTGVPPYRDEAHAGLLRTVQVVVERPTQTAQVVLVANDASPDACGALADAVGARLGGALHSLWWNGNPARTNTILGPHWHRWRGPEAVRETIGGADVWFPPGAFGQGNLPLADRVVALVHGWVPERARVVELYAGTGAIGLGLAARAAALAMNEASPDGLRGMAMGVAALDLVLQAHVRTLPGPAAAHTGAIADADVVIVDPPRKGIDAEVLAALVAAPPSRLAVVSCSVDAFAREAAALLDAGMRLAQLVPVALFPHTAHVETVALFTRDRAA